MRIIAEQLYKTMLEDVGICRKKDFDEEKETECCFQVCNKYWKQLQRMVFLYHFISDEEEIDFFKNCKPLFTSEIEYFNLVYHALLFQPFDYDEKERFWQRELLRLERFTESNQEFYHYYENRQTDLDTIYFLRRNNESVDFPEANPESLERKTCTSHDHLVSQLIALTKYTSYVNAEIEKINGKDQNSIWQRVRDKE